MGKIMCKGCKWWDDEEKESWDEFFYGKCRRRAPCLTLGMVEKRGADEALLAEFPRTESTLDWCGEFEKKDT